MQLETIARQRLFNQRLIASTLRHPAEIVQWLGAARAQDYAGAKWSLGMRLDAAAATDLLGAFLERPATLNW